MKITLVIEFIPDQPLRVTGPLQDKLLCFGMLELARQKIHEYKPSPIILAASVPVNGAQLGQPRP